MLGGQIHSHRSGGRDDHWVPAVRLVTMAKDLVENSSSGYSGVNPVFSPVSLQRIDPISLRDPAARASFGNYSGK